MQNDGRISPFQLLPQENILDEEGIRPCIPGRKRAFKKGIELALFYERIQADVHLRPEKMGKAHRLGKIGQRKISRTRARGKCGKSQIDGVCARRQGGFGAGDVSCRGQKFGVHLPMVRWISSCAAS